jgi:hypothetical protein
LIDITKRGGENFILDGYYFVAPATMYVVSTGQESTDPYIQSLHFIDESLLLVTLST